MVVQDVSLGGYENVAGSRLFNPAGDSNRYSLRLLADSSVWFLRASQNLPSGTGAIGLCTINSPSQIPLHSSLKITNILSYVLQGAQIASG